MSKVKIRYFCDACGHDEPKWLGRCPACGEWNTFREKVIRKTAEPLSPALTVGTPENRPLLLNTIQPPDDHRIPSGINEVDRVLGGWIMRGSSILIGGEPGIGKSTLMLQIAGSSSQKMPVLYITGEESPEQIKIRADRLAVQGEQIHIFSGSDLDLVLDALNEVQPSLVIIDSIQTLLSRETGAVPGTPSQLKTVCLSLIEWIRRRNAALFLVAHVTKDGAIAGPKVIEHMVDTVLYFEHSGSEARFLRPVKNRFGSIDEIGLFTMGQKGLEQIENPAGLFLIKRDGALPPGIAVAAVYEGTRVLLVEIQALTVPAKGAVSRIFSDRIDTSRVSRVAAVMEKHLNLRFSDQDLYINVAGGLKISEVGIDLPLAMALYSARTGLSLPDEFLAAGELSLAGEIRSIAHQDRRVKAAAELGYTKCLIPSRHKKTSSEESALTASSITEAISAVFQTGN